MRQRGAKVAGYTLLEICLAMAVMAIITAIAIPSTQGLLSEEHLRSVADNVSELARGARQSAISEGIPYALTTSDGVLYVVPWAGSASPLSQAVAATKLKGQVIVELQDVEGGKGLPKKELFWVFQPNGLSDPMNVVIRSSNSWMVQRYSPLTATVEHETSSFQ